jgi:hypothetical protein
MPEQSTTNCILSSIVTFLGGGFVGTVLGHFLAIGRDRRARRCVLADATEERKQRFLSFMRAWRLGVVRNSLLLTVTNFDNKVSLFEGEVSRIVNDYDKKRLEELVRDISSMRISRIKEETPDHQYPGREKLLTKIDALVNYLTSK